MKAISVWEPWATLIAMGLKQYETRSWKTFYRGPLLICASQKRLPFTEISTILSMVNLTPNDLSYGKALAIVDLTDVFPTENLFIQNRYIEQKFGDFSPGRYAWKLENIRQIKEPILIHGRQGLFDVPEVNYLALKDGFFIA